MRHALVLATVAIALLTSIFLLTGNPNLSTAAGGGNLPLVVDADGYTGVGTSMAIGTDDNPVISYSRLTSGDLKVAHCGNANCSSGNTLTTVLPPAQLNLSLFSTAKAVSPLYSGLGRAETCLNKIVTAARCRR